MAMKQRQEFRIVLLKRARRIAERKLELCEEERAARNVRYLRIYVRTHAQTDGQPENIMPSAPSNKKLNYRRGTARRAVSVETRPCEMSENSRD